MRSRTVEFDRDVADVNVPLVVDLDGTLLRTDLLIESGLAYLRTRPMQSYFPLWWLLSGKAKLKQRLAQEAKLDPAYLPYDPRVIALINEKRVKGHEIILATASHMIYAEQVAAHLKLFDRVFATEGAVNLSATRKRQKLVDEFGERGFDYVGNSGDDLPVWAIARHAYVVNPERGIETKAKALGNVEQIIATPKMELKAWMKALRFHQWVKNLLVFVPLLASHRLSEPDLLLNGLIAFVCFGFCASSVYLLNDLLDLTDDRRHKTKCRRPFASGTLPLKSGLIATPIFLLISFVGSFLLLPWQFSIALLIYYLLTFAYSIFLKRLMIVDVITLAMLYTLRIIAGTFAFQVSLTFWMLAFSLFIFLSLALVKRYAELIGTESDGKNEKTRGRGYYHDDYMMISTLGAASGYMSVMVLALYIQEQSTAALYRHPQVIWLACPLLLFWISRTWLLAYRGQMHQDPIIFAIKDRASLAVGMLFGITFWIAT
jgi:4-hydroxybenzoate polyprenyltransferase